MERKAESVDESKVYFVGVGESSSPDELSAPAGGSASLPRLIRLVAAAGHASCPEFPYQVRQMNSRVPEHVQHPLERRMLLRLGAEREVYGPFDMSVSDLHDLVDPGQDVRWLRTFPAVHLRYERLDTRTTPSALSFRLLQTIKGSNTIVLFEGFFDYLRTL